MNLFRNRNKKTIAELEDYYTNRQSNAMAWFMAFLSLLVTIAVLAALFFGGRWLWRTFVDNDTNNGATTSEKAPVDVSLGSSDDQSVSLGSSSDTGSSQEDAIVGGSVSNSDSGSSDEGVVSDEAASTERNSSNSEGATLGGSQSSSSDSSSSESEIPNTGAGEILVIVPLMTIALGYYISRRTQLNR